MRGGHEPFRGLFPFGYKTPIWGEICLHRLARLLIVNVNLCLHKTWLYWYGFRGSKFPALVGSPKGAIGGYLVGGSGLRRCPPWKANRGGNVEPGSPRKSTQAQREPGRAGQALRFPRTCDPRRPWEATRYQREPASTHTTRPTGSGLLT